MLLSNQNSFVLLLSILFVGLSSGCENQRYRPADYSPSSTTLPSTPQAASNGDAKSAVAIPPHRKPTNWMKMVGKGGDKVQPRTSRLPSVTNRGSNGTSLPARGTSLPLRGNRFGGTSLPARNLGSTLPNRATNSTLRGTSAPRRSRTTLPKTQRSNYRQGTTLPN